MKAIATEGAPKAVGPYSQAVLDGGFLFSSGQIPLDPATGALVPGGIENAVERVFDNIEAILKASGLTLDDVVKTSVYLLRMTDFAAMNGVYARRFGNHRPARSTVAVAELPKDASVEIDVIARLRG
ncbi:MAG TPA: RidA family protein [Thermoanaerobaculia bacterium]|jgi:2-iminobutanoate/2-iminopropanoate deaminase